MKVINLGERSSVINSYMAQLRDVEVQKNRTLFRRNMQRIARATAYEVSRTLQYSEKAITTPLGVKQVPTYDDRIVVGTVLRAGVAFHEGFLDTFDQADSAFVAAHRDAAGGQRPLGNGCRAVAHGMNEHRPTSIFYHLCRVFDHLCTPTKLFLRKSRLRRANNNKYSYLMWHKANTYLYLKA